jgi:hypothetical protein
MSAHAALERDVQSRRHAQRAFEDRFTSATTSGLDTEGAVSVVGKEIKIRSTLLEAQISLLKRSALLLNTTTEGPTLESLSASAPAAVAGAGVQGAAEGQADKDAGADGAGAARADGEATQPGGAGGSQVEVKLKLLQTFRKRSGEVEVRPVCTTLRPRHERTEPNYAYPRLLLAVPRRLDRRTPAPP